MYVSQLHTLRLDSVSILVYPTFANANSSLLKVKCLNNSNECAYVHTSSSHHACTDWIGGGSVPYVRTIATPAISDFE